MKIINTIKFPDFNGIKCIMMPFIQGDSESLPIKYSPYFDIIDANFIEKGKPGFLTIDESFVQAESSQRGYNALNSGRNVHIEVGRSPDMMSCWGKSINSWEPSPVVVNRWGNTWGQSAKVLLHDDTEVLIANSISDTCRVWNAIEKCMTPDGDLSHVIDKYPEETGILLKAGDLAHISIFTPHECINQSKSSNRQFFRIVGEGVRGREDYFTINLKMS